LLTRPARAGDGEAEIAVARASATRTLVVVARSVPTPPSSSARQQCDAQFGGLRAQLGRGGAGIVGVGGAWRSCSAANSRTVSTIIRWSSVA